MCPYVSIGAVLIPILIITDTTAITVIIVTIAIMVIAIFHRQ